MHGSITRAEKKQRQHSEFSLEAEKLIVWQKPCLRGGTRHERPGLRNRSRVALKERELHRLLWFAGLRLGIGAGTGGSSDLKHGEGNPRAIDWPLVG